MSKKKKSIQYRLLDIECWQHRIDAYPIKINCPYDDGLIIGETYDTKQYDEAEDRIREWFVANGFQRMEIMNPLYQYDGKAETVITIDVVKDKEISMQKNLEEKDTLPWFKKIQELLVLHENRMNNIFSFGGNVSMKEENGVLFSEDVIVREIEKDIQSAVDQGKHIASLLQMVLCGNVEATKALQWIRKDMRGMDTLINMFESKRISSAQQNLILRQIIPYREELTDKHMRRITVISNDVLRTATPNVRNKVLSMLSYFPLDALILLSEECRGFIFEISKTKQLNCSFPAREILEKLKPSKMQ